MPVLKNIKHERFCELVAAGTQIHDAFKAVGYKGVASQATKLRNNLSITDRIDELRSVAAEKAGITIERVVQEFVRIATADITEAVMWRKQRQKKNQPLQTVLMLQDSDKIPAHVRAAISSVKQTKDGVAVTFHPKAPALDSLAKYLGMFKPDAAVNLNISLAEIVRESYAAKPAAVEEKPAEGEKPETETK